MTVRQLRSEAPARGRKARAGRENLRAGGVAAGTQVSPAEARRRGLEAA